MSEQSERNEMWLEERDGKRARLVELREGETIVGPLEMAVIEAAINDQRSTDAFNAANDEDILGALAQNSTAARRTLEASVRALREARKPKEPSNG